MDRPDGLSSRLLSVFHPADATSDGWETPQTPQSRSPVTNSCATTLISQPCVPKSQVEVGWGCILSCMGIRCIAVYFTHTAHSPRPGSPVTLYSAYSLYSHTAIHAIHHTALYSLPQSAVCETHTSVQKPQPCRAAPAPPHQIIRTDVIVSP